MSAPRSLLLLLPLLLSAAARAQATMGFQDGVSPTPAYAGTRDLVLIEPDTDSRFDPNANYDSLQCAVDGYASRQVALLRWDVSALTPGSTVSAASIKVNVTNVSNNPYEIHELLRPWVASEATFFLSRAGTPWGAAGASASSDHAAPVLGTMTGDVGSRTFPLTAAGLAAVQRWIDLPAANDGVIVRDYTQENGFEFSSSEDSVLANRPTLSVTYGGVTTEFRQGSAPTAAYAGASDTTLAWGPRTGGNLNGRGLALAGGTQTGHVLLSFDLSALPSNATVSAATLTLRISNTGPGSFPLYEALRPWTETGATWTTYDGTTPWASTGGGGTADRDERAGDRVPLCSRLAGRAAHRRRGAAGAGLGARGEAQPGDDRRGRRGPDRCAAHR